MWGVSGLERVLSYFNYNFNLDLIVELLLNIVWRTATHGDALQRTSFTRLLMLLARQGARPPEVIKAMFRTAGS